MTEIQRPTENFLTLQKEDINRALIESVIRAQTVHIFGIDVDAGIKLTKGLLNHLSLIQGDTNQVDISSVIGNRLLIYTPFASLGQDLILEEMAELGQNSGLESIFIAATQLTDYQSVATWLSSQTDDQPDLFKFFEDYGYYNFAQMLRRFSENIMANLEETTEYLGRFLAISLDRVNKVRIKILGYEVVFWQLVFSFFHIQSSGMIVVM